MKHFLYYFNNAIHANWNAPALCDFHGDVFTFGQTATEIERLHLIFRSVGIKAGDKIAIYGKNSARWGITFFGVTSADAVAVPILNDFTVDSAANLIKHSESRVLFTDEVAWRELAEAGELCYLDVCDMHIDIWKQLIYHKNKWMSKALRTVIEYIKLHEFKQ